MTPLVLPKDGPAIAGLGPPQVVTLTPVAGNPVATDLPNAASQSLTSLFQTLFDGVALTKGQAGAAQAPPLKPNAQKFGTDTPTIPVEAEVQTDGANFGAMPVIQTPAAVNWPSGFDLMVPIRAEGQNLHKAAPPTVVTGQPAAPASLDLTESPPKAPQPSEIADAAPMAVAGKVSDTPAIRQETEAARPIAVASIEKTGPVDAPPTKQPPEIAQKPDITRQTKAIARPEPIPQTPALTALPVAPPPVLPTVKAGPKPLFPSVAEEKSPPKGPPATPPITLSAPVVEQAAFSASSDASGIDVSTDNIGFAGQPALEAEFATRFEQTNIALKPMPITPNPRAVAIQIVQAIDPGAEKTTEIRLDPIELGKVRLTLHATETGMNVQIIAERGETIDLMRKHLEVLEAEFEGLGYQDVSFGFSQQSQDHPAEVFDPDAVGVETVDDQGRPVQSRALNTHTITVSGLQSGLDKRL